MCDVDIDGVISTPDAPSIYDIPKVLHREELDAFVVRRLSLPFRDVDWTEWDDLLQRVHEPRETVQIALVGKYVDLSDAYLSVAEALRAGGFKHRASVEMRWVASDDCQSDSGAAAALADVHGVLIPGGFGIRGIEGKIGAIRHARSHGLPVLGLCLGLQCIVIEAARSVGLARRQFGGIRPGHSRPGDLHDGRPEAHRGRRGGPGRHDATGRLPRGAGAGFDCGRGISGEEVSERHRHRYEVNNDYRDRIAAGGLRFSGTSPDGRLVEFVEYPREVQPVPRRHAGPSRVEEPSHPAASAVRRVHRCSAGLQSRRTVAGGDSRAASNGASAAGGRGAAAQPVPESESVADHEFETTDSETVYVGNIFALRADEVTDARRQDRPARSGGALRCRRRRAMDDDAAMAVIYQYRHRSAGGCGSCRPDSWTPPTRTRWSGQRELRRKPGCRRRDWRVLVDIAVFAGLLRRVRTGVSGDRFGRGRSATCPRRRGRSEGAVVSARDRGRDGADGRGRQHHRREPAMLAAHAVAVDGKPSRPYRTAPWATVDRVHRPRASR